MAFSDKLVAARKAKKLSQESLSKISGVSQSAISFIEKGMRSPTEETMKLLADALGISVTDLMDDQSQIKNTANEGGYKDKIADLCILLDVTPYELQRILDFAEGLKASRK